MNNLKCVIYEEKNKISIKMKRIALIFIGVITLLAACNSPVEEQTPPNPEQKPGEDGKTKLSLNVHIPNNSAATYANEIPSPNENFIDSIYFVLYQGSVAIDTTGFHRTDATNPNKTFTIRNDSIIEVGYEVNNITTGALNVQVFANRMNPTTLGSNTEIPLPQGNASTSFYMSGETASQLTNTGTAYFGEVHLVRNVAKLRINVSLNSIFIPNDLDIDYNNIIVEVTKTPNTTSKFDNSAALDLAPGNYISYPPRTIPGTGPTNLRRSASKFVSGNSDKTLNGGQIDSLYLYENKRSSFDLNDPSANKTQIKVTIPTTSPTEGNKTASFTYELTTNLNNTSSFNILRNYIYTLNIKVRGQSLEPLITLELQPWNDVYPFADILGTYLTTDISEIVFNSNGEATINFCSDAQAVYFDFGSFNAINSAQIGFNASDNIEPIGIEKADINLAPSTHNDGQILLDKQHCGSFTFKLKPGHFPEFPNVNFSGSICMRAGNIVKCFTFPGVTLYDAHFIVGEPLFGGEIFTNASVQINTGGGNWAEVSTSRLYNNSAQSSYSGGAAPIYLHLDENLTGNERTATITLTNSNTNISRRVKISQLPALRVGRFGSLTTNAEVSTFDMSLFTEQIYEPSTLVQYANAANAPVPTTNYIFNGFGMTSAHLNITNYTNGPFNFQSAVYSAINYCAYKNRPNNKTNSFAATDLKWYMPSQAQLMGMWITHESYKNTSTGSPIRYFTVVDSIAYWSSTSNSRIMANANEAQYVSFRFGNVGHTKMYLPNDGNKRYWTRCVRNTGTSAQYPTSPMVSTGIPVTINFANGLPLGSYVSGSTNSKTNNGNGTGTENATNNLTVYNNLRVAYQDATSPVKWNAANCSGYNEPGLSSGWRLPTQRELQAIWILQSEIKVANPSFNLLSDKDYYWSATEAAQSWSSSANKFTNAWVVYGSINDPGGSGNTPHRNKDEYSRVRCVHE